MAVGDLVKGLVGSVEMWENLIKYQVILGSQSPRRVELLAGLDIAFRQEAMPDIDESYPRDLAQNQIPEYIALKKAQAYASLMSENTLLITADTIVLLAGEVLGKPKTKEDARMMVLALSGQEHQVITGVCVKTWDRCEHFSCTTSVRFGIITPEEAEYYVAQYTPMDKAGAYGIQEWIGYKAIESITGSFYNVMGLPVHRLASLLATF